jgi:hypothetical protein
MVYSREGGSDLGVVDVSFIETYAAIAPQDVRWYRSTPEPNSDSESEYESAPEAEPEKSEEKPTKLFKGAYSITKQSKHQGALRELPKVQGWEVDQDTLIFDTVRSRFCIDSHAVCSYILFTKELNHALAGLPENSTLTVSLLPCSYSNND